MKFNNSLFFILNAIQVATLSTTSSNSGIKSLLRSSLVQNSDTSLRAADVPVGKVNSKMGPEDEAKRLFNAIGLSYCPTPLIIAANGTFSKNISNGFKVLRIFDDHKYQTRSYLAELPRKKQLVMSFRGSINQKNWESNLETNQVKLDTRKHILVHEGYKKITESMAPKAIRYLKSLLSQSKYKDYTLIINGHSLGGGVGTLSFMKYKEALRLPWNRIRLVTFGSPRVGNKHFANWVNSKPTYSTRVVNGNDPIPKLPIKNYVHIQTELYIKDQKSIFCKTDSFEDPNCSASTEFILDGDAHDTAWGLFIQEKYC